MCAQPLRQDHQPHTLPKKTLRQKLSAFLNPNSKLSKASKAEAKRMSKVLLNRPEKTSSRAFSRKRESVRSPVLEKLYRLQAEETNLAIRGLKQDISGVKATTDRKSLKREKEDLLSRKRKVLKGLQKEFNKLNLEKSKIGLHPNQKMELELRRSEIHAGCKEYMVKTQTQNGALEQKKQAVSRYLGLKKLYPKPTGKESYELKSFYKTYVEKEVPELRSIQTSKKEFKEMTSKFDELTTQFDKKQVKRVMREVFARRSNWQPIKTIEFFLSKTGQAYLVECELTPFEGTVTSEHRKGASKKSANSFICDAKIITDSGEEIKLKRSFRGAQIGSKEVAKEVIECMLEKSQDIDEEIGVLVHSNGILTPDGWVGLIQSEEEVGLLEEHQESLKEGIEEIRHTSEMRFPDLTSKKKENVAQEKSKGVLQKTRVPEEKLTQEKVPKNGFGIYREGKKNEMPPLKKTSPSPAPNPPSKAETIKVPDKKNPDNAEWKRSKLPSNIELAVSNFVVNDPGFSKRLQLGKQKSMTVTQTCFPKIKKQAMLALNDLVKRTGGTIADDGTLILGENELEEDFADTIDAFTAIISLIAEIDDLWRKNTFADPHKGEDMAKMPALLRTLDLRLKNVLSYTHCKSGKDRTGLVMASSEKLALSQSIELHEHKKALGITFDKKIKEYQVKDPALVAILIPYKKVLTSTMIKSASELIDALSDIKTMFEMTTRITENEKRKVIEKAIIKEKLNHFTKNANGLLRAAFTKKNTKHEVHDQFGYQAYFEERRHFLPPQAEEKITFDDSPKNRAEEVLEREHRDRQNQWMHMGTAVEIAGRNIGRSALKLAAVEVLKKSLAGFSPAYLTFKTHEYVNANLSIMQIVKYLESEMGLSCLGPKVRTKFTIELYKAIKQLKLPINKEKLHRILSPIYQKIKNQTSKIFLA